MSAWPANLTPATRRVLLTLGTPTLLLLVQAIVYPIPGGVYLMGVILGLLGALVAVGMVLIYRTNRIINFSQSALGLVPTVFAVQLIVHSQFAYSVGAVAGLAAAALLGTVVSAGVIRRFAHSSRLILTAATIGLAQLLLGISIFLPELWGHVTQAEEINAPWELEFTVDPLTFRADHVLALVVAPICLAVVALVLLRTRVGSAVRAAADSADRASLLGIPVQRMHLLIWSGAAALSFVGMFLRVSIVGLPPASLESLTALLAALTALTLGGFTKLLRVAIIAVVLGVIEQAVAWNNPENPQVFAVVLAALTIVSLLAYRAPTTRAGRDLTSTWQVLDDPPPLAARIRESKQFRLLALAPPLTLAVGGIVLPSILGQGDLLKASTVLVFAIVGTSLVILTGWAGQVSLGQMGFVAVGAAVGPVLTVAHGWDLAPALVASALAGAAVAVAVGLPALRVRGLFLAVTTLAFSVATAAYLLNPRYASWIPASRIDRPTLLWIFDLESQESMYWVCLVAFALVYLIARTVRSNRLGRVMAAQRDSELASESYGISTARVRLTAFALSGAMAAGAGCLLAHLIQSYPEPLLGPDQSIAVFSSTIVGGIASAAGGLVGATVFNATGWFLSGPIRLLSTAVGVLAVLLIFPSGVSGAALALRGRVLGRLFGIDDGIDEPEPDANVARPGHTRQGTSTEQGGHLEVLGLEVAYGDAKVINGVDLSVGPGDTVALLGTNGAGKSTILNAIGGLVAPAAGTVRFEGTDITGRPAHAIARLGISVCPGGRGVFPSLTVAENLELACWLDSAGSHDRVDEVLEMFPALAARRSESTANLSGGEQQMLALGMAYIPGPALLIIDELSLGLAPIVVEQLLRFIDQLREIGTSVLVVEQSISLALSITDQAVFLERGRIQFTGETAELLERPDLYRSIYLADAPSRAPAPERAEVASREIELKVTDASAHYGGVRALSGASFEVRHGETLGIIGPNGAGKSTLLDVVSGVIPMVAGSVELGGQDLTPFGLTSRARAGLGRSFQDARLFPSLTVEETIAVAGDRFVETPGFSEALVQTPAHHRSSAVLQTEVSDLIRMLNLDAVRGHRVSELSTGQRHVLDIACLLAARPNLLLLDEPTSGLAQAEVEALAGLLRAVIRERDLTVVVVEHDIPFVSSISDRIMAMDQGRIVTIGAPDEVLSHPDVVASYLGSTPETVNRSRRASLEST